MRASALFMLLAPLALAANCGGSAFTSGSESDASTGGSSGGSSGSDGSGSSSGGGSDAPSCTPDTLNQRCNDCIASHCEDPWCACVQDAACATYVGCRLRGNSISTCTGACGCTVAELGAGDKLIACTTTHCASECAATSSSSSSGGGSGSGSSSGGMGSSSGGSSGSSSGMSGSSSGNGSGSGGSSDGGSTCVCPACTNGQVCCTLAGATDYCKCYDPTCLSCCM